MGKMKNMSTTLEIPEGSKATIQGKVIDGKNYLVVEIEERKSEFKDGDFVVLDDGWVSIYKGAGESRDTISDYTGCWISGIDRFFEGTDSRIMDNSIRYATDKEKQILLDHLAKCGYEWDGEKLVEVLREGDMAIFWDDNTEDAIISVCKRLNDNGSYVDHLGLCWDNAIKWDGTKEQYEKVLRGELK